MCGCVLPLELEGIPLEDANNEINTVTQPSWNFTYSEKIKNFTEKFPEQPKTDITNRH